MHAEIELHTDRQLSVSALLANLTQNALKYSNVGGQVILRAKLFGSKVIIEVEGECGGLAVGIAHNQLKPFASGGLD